MSGNERDERQAGSRRHTRSRGIGHRQLAIVIGARRFLFRDALRRILTADGFDIAGEAVDGDGVLGCVEQHRPDVVVLGAVERTSDCLQTGIAVRRRWPEVALICVVQESDDLDASALLAQGAGRIGCVIEERVTDVASFLACVRCVVDGGTVIDPEVAIGTASGTRNPLLILTPRERQVLDLVSSGRSNRGIAQSLAIGDDAVERHMNRILAKLDIAAGRCSHRRVLAVLACLSSVAPEGTASRTLARG